MVDFASVRNEVVESIEVGDATADEYDVDGIVAALRDVEPDMLGIDDVDPDLYWSVVEDHRLGGGGDVETRTEYEVSSGIEGSGWTDGNAYATLAEAEAAFEAELREPVDPHRYRVVRLDVNEADYDGGGCVEVRWVRTLREERC